MHFALILSRNASFAQKVDDLVFFLSNCNQTRILQWKKKKSSFENNAALRIKILHINIRFFFLLQCASFYAYFIYHSCEPYVNCVKCLILRHKEIFYTI